MFASFQHKLQALSRASSVCFSVVLADGSRFQNREGEPAFSIRFRDAAAQRRLLWWGYLGLMEGYFDGTVEIEGPLQLAVRAGVESGFERSSVNPLLRLANAWHELRHSNADPQRARRNAEFHYALGTDFYRLWLDLPYMMYTCAYWTPGTQTIEQAQQNKLEHVCRKLDLRPGDSVLDIGCGWGGFLFYAAARHGVGGVGVNTTGAQVQAMQREIERQGLQQRIRAVHADFRAVQGQFDRCASIGVLEHAGRDQCAQVVRAHADSLKPGGIGVLHFIGHVGRYETTYWIRKHIFPGGWIPSLGETLEAMDACGLEVLDVENLRRHYALTLDAWAARFDANWDAVHALDPQRFDARFRRKWLTYLWGCAEMFRSPRSYTHLFQITYSKGNQPAGGYPMSRAFLYRDGAAS